MEYLTHYRDVKILENYFEKKITIIFPNKSRINYPFQYKKEKQIDYHAVEHNVDLDMFVYNCFYCLTYPIFFGFLVIKLFSATSNIEHIIFSILSLMLLTGTYFFNRWLVNRKRKHYQEIFYNIVDVRDSDAEKDFIDIAINDYDPSFQHSNPLIPPPIRNLR